MHKEKIDFLQVIASYLAPKKMHILKFHAKIHWTAQKLHANEFDVF